MTTITNGGVNATLQSNTLEGQFVQCIEYFQQLEANGVTSYFVGNYDSDALTFSGNFTVPIVLATSGLTYTGNTDNFLTGTFNAGTGGTFNAPLALNYFLQILTTIIRYQNDPAKNLQKNQNVTCSINMNKETLSGQFTVPVAKTITATGIAFTPVAYLL